MTKDEFFWVVVYQPESMYYDATLFPYTLSDIRAHGWAPVAAFQTERAAVSAETQLNRAFHPG
ncbi:MAG: hypothetical protein MN733_18505, partial [Nitrososphaera sp.]|nr:hypothetical protein [Nitrososphaera sp.]